jgi:PhnB protein
MLQLSAYLGFDGTCAEALKSDEKVLAGKIVLILTNAEARPPLSGDPGNSDRVMHGAFVIDGQIPGQPYAGISGFNRVLSSETEQQAKHIFAGLADGGRIVMPPQLTEFAKIFAILVDKFGTPWSIIAASRS